TFTDVTAFDEDQRELVAVRKYLSDPAQPAAVMENITADLARDFGADSVSLILHGSTAALNTLLEGKGVRVGLLTTPGFRAVHEKAAAEIIRATAPDLYVSLSHEVNPEWREYERTASTVANAYIGPPVARYLRTLEELSLRRFPRSRALMMKSDGGAASAGMLTRTPIQTVMSRPVAGIIGGRHLGDVK